MPSDTATAVVPATLKSGLKRGITPRTDTSVKKRSSDAVESSIVIKQ